MWSLPRRPGFVAVVAAAGLLLSAPLLALTAGDLVLKSAPGVPLRAVVQLELQPGEELASIVARLADSESYTARELERPPFADALHFALRDRGAGRVGLELYSDVPWDGTDAILLLQLNWPRGELQQQYPLHWQSPSAEPEYVAVNTDDTLDRIAIRLSEGRNRSYLHMMYALYLANPDAFYRGNMNNLKSGVRLRVPSDEELNRLQNREVFATIREQYRQWQEGGAEGSGGSEAGRMLASLSEAQAGVLNLNAKPEQLHEQLATLVAQNEAMEQENTLLRERLAQLEQRMAQMSDKVIGFDAPAATTGAPVTPPASEKGTPPPAQGNNNPKTKTAETSESGALSAPVMLLAILLAVAAVYLIRRSARRGAGR